MPTSRTSAAGSFGLNDAHPLNMLAIEVVAGAGAQVIPLVAGLPEGVQDTVGGDSSVRGDVQDVARVVVEPGDDLAVRACGEAVVGEVGLPALVGLLGGEADVGRAGALAGVGLDVSLAGQDAVDRGAGHDQVVVVVQVPGDGVRAGIQAPGRQVLAQLDDELDDRAGRGARGAVRAS